MLETERLLLRRPTAADEDMRHHLEGWERNGIGKFVVVRREDGAVLGRVGVQLLATEAARAVRDWYEAERLVSLIQPGNERSEAVARRLGAAPGRSVDLSDGPHVIWVHRSAKMPSE